MTRTVKRSRDSEEATVVLLETATADEPTPGKEWPGDPWGRSATFARWGGRLAGLRWDVSVGGTEHLPKRAGALLVCNARLGAFNELLATWALSEASGRVVRFVGVIDVAPIGPLMRKVGGLLADPGEVAGALRAGELVMISTKATRSGRLAGRIRPDLIEAATLIGAAVIPVATMSATLTRSARVEVGAQIRPRKPRRGPLTAPELADATRFHLQRILDQTTQPGTLISAISA